MERHRLGCSVDAPARRRRSARPSTSRRSRATPPTAWPMPQAAATQTVPRGASSTGQHQHHDGARSCTRIIAAQVARQPQPDRARVVERRARRPQARAPAGSTCRTRRSASPKICRKYGASTCIARQPAAAQADQGQPALAGHRVPTVAGALALGVRRVGDREHHGVQQADHLEADEVGAALRGPERVDDDQRERQQRQHRQHVGHVARRGEAAAWRAAPATASAGAARARAGRSPRGWRARSTGPRRRPSRRARTHRRRRAGTAVPHLATPSRIAVEPQVVAHPVDAEEDAVGEHVERGRGHQHAEERDRDRRGEHVGQRAARSPAAAGVDEREAGAGDARQRPRR